MYKQSDYYNDFVKSAISVANATMNNTPTSPQLNQHIFKLQSMGVDRLVITIKGTPLSAPIICSYEIDLLSDCY